MSKEKTQASLRLFEKVPQIKHLYSRVPRLHHSTSLLELLNVFIYFQLTTSSGFFKFGFIHVYSMKMTFSMPSIALRSY